jgi:hypothetical protein
MKTFSAASTLYVDELGLAMTATAQFGSKSSPVEPTGRANARTMINSATSGMIVFIPASRRADAAISSRPREGVGEESAVPQPLSRSDTSSDLPVGQRSRIPVQPPREK